MSDEPTTPEKTAEPSEDPTPAEAPAAPPVLCAMQLLLMADGTGTRIMPVPADQEDGVQRTATPNDCIMMLSDALETMRAARVVTTMGKAAEVQQAQHEAERERQRLAQQEAEAIAKRNGKILQVPRWFRRGRA